MSSQMIFEEAKKIDLVLLLAELNYMPVRVIKQDYWYKSPFRNEHTASFKVDRTRNIYYDHGEGQGGNIIDFAARFFRCDAKAAAQKVLEHSKGNNFSFHPQQHPALMAGEKKEANKGGIEILAARPLQNIFLANYLKQRKIPLKIAQQYCKEVDFLLNGKRQYAIGFANRSGGYELRNAHFKGSSSPKDITFFDNGKKDAYVFEGFFDFLSFAVIRPQTGPGLTNCLVLNSLAFFEKSRSLMEQHNKIILFLDRGLSGRQHTQKTIAWNKELGLVKYTDNSDLYKYRDDLNAWLVDQSRQQQQQVKRGGRGL